MTDSMKLIVCSIDCVMSPGFFILVFKNFYIFLAFIRKNYACSSLVKVLNARRNYFFVSALGLAHILHPKSAALRVYKTVC